MKIFINRLLLPMGFQLNQLNGVLDFLLGILLVIAPWFFVQEHNIQSLALVMAAGSALILYTIFTDYRHGIVRFIARKVHEAMDLTLGVTFMGIWSVGYTMTGIFLGILLLTGTFLYY